MSVRDVDYSLLLSDLAKARLVESEPHSKSCERWIRPVSAIVLHVQVLGRGLASVAAW